MANIISGPGVGLPFPPSLYPANLQNGAPFNEGTNEFTLPPGAAMPVPAGRFMVNAGNSAVIQYVDPVTGIWRHWSSARSGPQFLHSDGFNFRVANLTGCAVAASITNAGSGYTSAPTVAASTGSSTWQAIVGGAISSITVTTAGAGYTVPPIVLLPAPPNPGVQATAQAFISGGCITSITMLNVGAGYASATAAQPTLLPNPTDPNFNSITTGVATIAALGSSGSITAILCTNNGGVVASAPTLSISGGGGSSATAAALIMQTVTTVSVATAGTGYAGIVEVTTLGGGNTTTEVVTNPSIELIGYVPRPMIATATVAGTSISTVATIIDGGLFVGTPSALILSTTAATTAASVVLTLGSAADTVFMQTF